MSCDIYCLNHSIFFIFKAIKRHALGKKEKEIVISFIISAHKEATRMKQFYRNYVLFHYD